MEKSTRFFFPVILLIMAYEWLISGFDKLFNGSFITDMHRQMVDSIPNMQFQFYAHLLQKFCMPHCEVVATLVETGEIAVGVSFLILALYAWKGKVNAPLSRWGVATGVVSAFMTLNFFLYQGGSFFLNASDPFDEGIPIDVVMVLIQVAIAAYFWAIGKRHDNNQSNIVTNA